MMAEVVRMVVVMRCPPTPCSPTARVVPGGLSKRDCKHKWARPHQYPTQKIITFYFKEWTCMESLTVVGDTIKQALVAGSGSRDVSCRTMSSSGKI